MGEDGRSEMRRLLGRAVEGFAAELQRRGAVPGLREAMAAYLGGLALKRMADAGYEQVLAVIQDDLLKTQRADPFQRLLIHPLSDDFEAGTLSRACLPNYFSFLHLVLGDQVDALSARAAAIAEDLHPDDGAPFDWDAFYDDSRSVQILWAVLVQIAETFRRFDARKDWFLGLMEYQPQAVSVASNAFLPKAVATDEPSPPFSGAEFNRMFAALFGPLRHLDARQRQRFETDYGRPPEKVFGPLWENLETSGVVW